MTQAGILARGVRWRLGGSLLNVLTAAIAVGAATIGPLYLEAGGDSLVRSRVAGASEYQTGTSLAPAPGRQLSVTQLMREWRALVHRFDVGRLYGAPITTVDSSIRLQGPRGAPYASQLLDRDGICAHLTFVAGGCRLGSGDVLVSGRSARDLGVSLGSTIVARPAEPSTARSIRLRVTGVYAAPSFSAPYWFGEATAFFPYGYSTGPPDPIPELDSLVTSQSTALAVPSADLPSIQVQTPLLLGAVGLGNASVVARALDRAERAAESGGLTLSTDLPSLIADATHQHHLMTTIVAIAAVQLALLAIWVLAAQLLRSADLRRAELRVARLRGFPLASILLVTVAEPAILCAVGVVLGVVLAWAGALAAASIVFSHGTRVAPDVWAFAGFGTAVATIAAVLGFAALRLLRGSALGESTPTARDRSRSRAIGDVAILVLSVVGLVAAATSGALASHSDPIAAAAPALVALGTSVIAVRIVEFLCRGAIRATVDTRAVASFLAVRQIIRRPAQLRQSRTLIIALCLACFAISAWSVARTNRVTASTFSVGARTVVDVTAPPSGLIPAVERVDPGGHYAMAVVQIVTPSSRVLAVQSSRLSAVLSWPRGVSHASLARVRTALTPRTAPVIALGSGPVRLQVTVQGTGDASGRLGTLNLGLWVFNNAVGTSILSLGTLHAGTHAYAGSLATSCPGGCRLVGLGALPGGAHPPVSGTVELSVDRLAVDGRVRSSAIAADLSASDWRSGVSGVGGDRESTGVALDVPAAAIADDEGAVGGITPAMAVVADVPAEIPCVAGTTAGYVAATSGSGSATVAGIDGTQVTLHPVISATALPRLGSDAEMADLGLLTRAQTDPAVPSATDQVWLGPRAPADALSRLRAAGLKIDGVDRATTSISRAEHTGPALAYDFMLFATLVALLTAAVSTFGVLAAGTRQRSGELAALEVIGVGRPVLARSLGIETAILAVTALFGAGAGALGAALAIPSLPQLGTATTAPLSYALPVFLIVLVAAGGVVVVILTTAVAAAGILLRMSPTLLRAAPDDSD